MKPSIILEQRLYETKMYSRLTAGMDPKTVGHMQKVRENFTLPFIASLNNISTLMEAEMTADQVTQAFGYAEKIATAGGDNRSMLGKGADAAGAIGAGAVDLAKKGASGVKELANKLVAQNKAKLEQSLPPADAGPVEGFEQKAQEQIAQVQDPKAKQSLLDLVKQAAKNPAVQTMVLAGIAGIATVVAGPAIAGLGLGMAVTGALTGGVVGGLTGVVRGAMQGQGLSGALKQGAIGAGLGAIGGGVAGAVAQGAQAYMQNKGQTQLPAADADANRAADENAAAQWAAGTPEERAQIEQTTGMTAQQLQSKIPDEFDSGPGKGWDGQARSPNPIAGKDTFPDGTPIERSGGNSSPGYMKQFGGDQPNQGVADPNAPSGLGNMSNAQVTKAMDQVAPVAGGDADPNKYYNSLSPEQQRATDDAVYQQAKASGATGSTSTQQFAGPDAKDQAVGQVRANLDNWRANNTANAGSLDGGEAPINPNAGQQQVDLNKMVQNKVDSGAIPAPSDTTDTPRTVRPNLDQWRASKTMTQSRVNTGKPINENVDYELTARMWTLRNRVGKPYNKIHMTEAAISRAFEMAASSQLNEGPLDWIKKKAGQAADFVKTKVGNVTNKITADKLQQAWTKAGSPTDSVEVGKIMAANGVPQDSVDQILKNMGVPNAPAAPAQAGAEPDATSTPPAQAQAGADASGATPPAPAPAGEAPTPPTQSTVQPVPQGQQPSYGQGATPQAYGVAPQSPQAQAGTTSTPPGNKEIAQGAITKAQDSSKKPAKTDFTGTIQKGAEELQGITGAIKAGQGMGTSGQSLMQPRGGSTPSQIKIKDENGQEHAYKQIGQKWYDKDNKEVPPAIAAMLTQQAKQQAALGKDKNAAPLAGPQGEIPGAKPPVPAKQEPVKIGGQTLDPKNPADKKIIDQVQAQQGGAQTPPAATPATPATAQQPGATPPAKPGALDPRDLNKDGTVDATEKSIARNQAKTGATPPAQTPAATAATPPAATTAPASQSPEDIRKAKQADAAKAAQAQMTAKPAPAATPPVTEPAATAEPVPGETPAQTAAKTRTGGKVAGQVSQTPNAIRQRDARTAAAQAKATSNDVMGRMTKQLGAAPAGGPAQTTPNFGKQMTGYGKTTINAPVGVPAPTAQTQPTTGANTVPATTAPATQDGQAHWDPASGKGAKYDGVTGKATPAWQAEMDKKDAAEKAKFASAQQPVATTNTPAVATTNTPAQQTTGQAATQAANTGGNPVQAGTAALQAKNPKMAAMMAQAGLDDNLDDVAPTAPATTTPKQLQTAGIDFSAALLRKMKQRV